MLGIAMAIALFQPLPAGANGRWESSSGETYWTSGQELGCTGLAVGEYTGASSWQGQATAVLDAQGRLHVTARGTYAWAVFPYSDAIAGPYDTDQRLYFGSVEIDIARVVDNYTPGTSWVYQSSEIEVSGRDGTFVLRPSMALYFAADRSGPGSVGTAVGGAFCPQ